MAPYISWPPTNTFVAPGGLYTPACGATMVKEIDKVGIPTAHITALPPIAQVTGSNRIVPGITINNPCSNVDLPAEQQIKIQKNFIARALKAVSTDISEQTLF